MRLSDSLYRRMNLYNAKFSNAGFWKAAKERHDRYWAHRNRRLPLSEDMASVQSESNKFGTQNPFIKPPEPCILCKIPVDFKNVRLLSQFISPFTGNILNNRATGLCFEKQIEVEAAIAKSRKSGLMPRKFKDPRFHGDYTVIDERRIS